MISYQATPPPYDYSVINVPVFHFWSRNDILQNREDIDNTIMNTLRKEVVKVFFKQFIRLHVGVSYINRCEIFNDI